MGFFSSVFRGVKKVFSGAAKVVKKAVKGTLNFVKSPAGMATLMLLGGAFMAGGGFTSFAAGRAGGMSRWGSIMSTMKTGFTNITAPVRGLFGGTKALTGVTLSGEGAITGGLGEVIAGTQMTTSGAYAGAGIMGGTTGGQALLPITGGKFGSTFIPLPAGGKTVSSGLMGKTSSFLKMAREKNKKYDLVGKAAMGKVLTEQRKQIGVLDQGFMDPFSSTVYNYDMADLMSPNTVTNIPITKRDVNLAAPFDQFIYNAYNVNQKAVNAETIAKTAFNNDINSWRFDGSIGGANRSIG